jgi:transposase InsO family protein
VRRIRNRYATRAEVTAEAFAYIEVLYNRKRRHFRLGYRSPAQCLEHWLTTEEGQKRVA